MLFDQSDVDIGFAHRSDFCGHFGAAWHKEVALFEFLQPRASQPLMKEVAGMGVTITDLSPAEREAFIKATRPVYAKWKNSIGADLVNAAEKAIAARKK